MNNNAGNTPIDGYWRNGQWYSFQPSTWTFTYPYTLYPDMPAKIIDQLLKRIAELEARLYAKENNGPYRS